ncbi:hypothetical protein [Streptacidiphilus jiangxiensis]|uniref:Uncharacterized protein n=1 Tax=Streptacidiphilus jiangxiensis TaxID=235985 RepID=A0A1H8ASL7_STRJI|nr:hypothetical protein [Streptacidiphilus jiangxiensis]SEM73761.1 hypothetical protein SAMN05414137_1504 [Streptacidiphilus jiangxiensis]
MRSVTMTLAAATAAAAVLALSACSSSSGGGSTSGGSGNTASCEDALVKELEGAGTSGATPSAARPAECAGIDALTFAKLTAEAAQTALKKVASEFPTALPTDLSSDLPTALPTDIPTALPSWTATG